MQLFAIFNELRRRRFLVAAALLLSIAVGMSVAYRVSPGLPPQLKARQYSVGVASARVLINTPSSIVADLNPNGGGSLATHAQLLGNLLASEQVRTAIAKKAGVPLSNLVVEPLSVAGVVQTPLAVVAPAPTGASTLSVNADPLLPLITISAQAPDAAKAAALANGAVTALQSYIQTVAAAEKIPTSRRPVVTSLGAAQARSTTRGPSRLYGVIAVIFLFGLFCYMIIAVSGARRRLRALRESRRAGLAPAAEFDPAPADDADERLQAYQSAAHPSSAPSRERGFHEPIPAENNGHLPRETTDGAHTLTDEDASMLLAAVGSETMRTPIASETTRAEGPRGEPAGAHSRSARTTASGASLFGRFRRD
jgi:hypothetical protein